MFLPPCLLGCGKAKFFLPCFSAQFTQNLIFWVPLWSVVILKCFLLLNIASYSSRVSRFFNPDLSSALYEDWGYYVAVRHFSIFETIKINIFTSFIFLFFWKWSFWALEGLAKPREKGENRPSLLYRFLEPLNDFKICHCQGCDGVREGHLGDGADLCRPARFQQSRQRVPQDGRVSRLLDLLSL